MKFLNIILFYIYINTASSQIKEDDKRFYVKHFPKKVPPSLFQVNYSGKYVKNRNANDSPIVNLHKAYYEIPTSQRSPGTRYTAFIPLYPNAHMPDSLLFQQNVPIDQKPKYINELPLHVWTSLRKKRSADAVKDELNKADNKTEALKNDEKKEAKQVEKKEAKQVEKKEDKHVEKKGNKQTEQKGVRLAGKKAGNVTKHGKKLRKGGHPVRHLNGTQKLRGHKKGPGGKQIRKQRKGHGKDARRLIAARDALIEQYPYVISIQKNEEHWCAGAILNPRLIITTANCLWKSSQISRLKVRVGSRYNNHGGQTFGIQEVMKHPGWKIRKNPDCDVALALLDGNIRFSHSVHGVDLPNIAMMPAFDDAWVVSWGSERRDGIFDTGSNSLQVYHVRLMDRNKCDNITRRFGVAVTENFICLAQTGKRAPCTRDTGAPAVSDGVLWGLASWGIRKLCGTERYPAMFSYLGSHDNIDFITNASHVLMSEHRQYPFPDRLPSMRATKTKITKEAVP